MVQTDCLRPKVGGHWRCSCIHRVNGMNSCGAQSNMTVPKRLLWLLLFTYYYFIIRQHKASRLKYCIQNVRRSHFRDGEGG